MNQSIYSPIRCVRLLPRLSLVAVLATAVLAGSAHAQQLASYADLKAQWAKAAEAEGQSFGQLKQQVDKVWDERADVEGELLFLRDESKKPALEKRRDELGNQVVALSKAMIGLAPALSDAESGPLRDAIRRTSLLSYQAGDYETAAVLGEHFAKTYPKDEGATQGAEVAVAAYTQLYNKATDKQAAMRPLFRVNSYIVETWPESESGKQSLARLAQLALASGDRDQALSIAEKLPESSPQRGEIELRFALVDYSKLLEARKQAKDDPNSITDAQLVKQRDAVVKSLQPATERVRKSGGDVTYTLLAAEVTLAQLYNERGDFEQAIKLMERPNSGPLDLANTGSQVVRQREAFPGQIYQTALQSYLGQGNLDRVLQMMEKLSGTTGNAGELTRRQYGFASQIYNDLQSAIESGEPAANLAARKQGLAKLIAIAVAQPEGNTPQSRTWGAQTLLKLASAGDTGSVKPADNVLRLYEQSAEAFETLIASLKDQPEEKRRLQAARVGLAQAQRRLGQYDKALANLEAVLKDSQMNLAAQLEAAQIYQDWGFAINQTQGKAGAEDAIEKYTYAINGGPEVRTATTTIKSPILGWARLVNMLSRSSQAVEQFQEARYNLAMCTRNVGFLYEAGSGKQKEWLEKAERQLQLGYRFDPSMGGPDWLGRYESLLETIQGALGKEKTGFPAKN